MQDWRHKEKTLMVEEKLNENFDKKLQKKIQARIDTEIKGIEKKRGLSDHQGGSVVQPAPPELVELKRQSYEVMNEDLEPSKLKLQAKLLHRLKEGESRNTLIKRKTRNSRYSRSLAEIRKDYSHLSMDAEPF